MNRPTSKTPYEIRLELLQLASGILMAQHAARSAEEAKGDGRAFGTTTAPTTEEIIAEADKMNSFVSKANSSH